MRIKIGAKFSPRTPFFNDQTQKAISIYYLPYFVFVNLRNDQEQREEGINRTSLTQELQL